MGGGDDRLGGPGHQSTDATRTCFGVSEAAGVLDIVRAARRLFGARLCSQFASDGDTTDDDLRRPPYVRDRHAGTSRTTAGILVESCYTALNTLQRVKNFSYKVSTRTGTMIDTRKFANIKTIFFDVGDTLYISEEMEKEYPRQLLRLLAKTKNIGELEAKQLLKETTEKLERSERHVTKVRAMKELGFTRAQVHEAFCKVDPSRFLTRDPELDRLILRLSKKYELGIISNFKRAHMLDILSILGLSEKQLSLMITEDIVQEIKPHPEPFQKAVELSGHAANECLYVADSPTKDIRPAKEVGMMTVLVKANPEQENMKYADGHIRDIKELIILL
jgi:HAD superfamily hydrolase (TIGR01509 family)